MQSSKAVVAFIPDSPSWDKASPGNFLRSSVSARFTGLQSDPENWTPMPRHRPIVHENSSDIHPMRVVGIQRRHVACPSSLVFSAHSRRTN